MKPEKTVRENPNYNFNTIENKKLRQNLLTITYIIPKANVKRPAIFLFRDMLFNSSAAYLTRRGLFRQLYSLSGAALSLSITEADRDYLFVASILATDDEYLKTFKNVRFEQVELLHELLSKGYSRENNILNRLKKNLIMVTKDALASPDFIAQRGLKTNFLPKTNFGELRYGTVAEIEKPTDTDLIQVQEELKTALRMVSYLGDPQARLCLKIKQLFKPSSYIPTLRTGELVISEPDDLKEDSPFKQSVFMAAYRLAPVKSENEYLIASLAAIMLSGSSDSLLFGTLREKLNLCYEVSADIVKVSGLCIISCYTDRMHYQRVLKETEKIMERGYESLTEESFKTAKRSLLSSFVSLDENLQDQDRFIRNATLLGIDKDSRNYLERIESLTLKQVVNYLGQNAKIGSYFVEGKGE